MGFFGGGGTEQRMDSYSGLRGLGSTAQDMANFLGPQVQSGVNFANTLMQNPSSFLNPQGLYAQQGNLFPSIVNYVANRVSANNAGRGMMSPENAAAVAGGSATAAAPFLLPLIGQNITGLQGLGANLFSSLLNTGAGSLGSESHGFMKTTAPGIGYNWANSFGNNLFGQFGKTLGGGTANGLMGMF